jgi:hypothetical protein
MSICYLDCHEARLSCYLVIHIETYYVHYSCFTSICDVFTNFSSHMSISNLSAQEISFDCIAGEHMFAPTAMVRLAGTENIRKTI